MCLLFVCKSEIILGTLLLHFPECVFQNVKQKACLPEFFQRFFSVCCVPVYCMVQQRRAGRCHALLSPVSEESGDEATNSEVSSSPLCPAVSTEGAVAEVSSSTWTFLIFYPNLQHLHAGFPLPLIS